MAATLPPMLSPSLAASTEPIKSGHRKFGVGHCSEGLPFFGPRISVNSSFESCRHWLDKSRNDSAGKVNLWAMSRESESDYPKELRRRPGESLSLTDSIARRLSKMRQEWERKLRRVYGQRVENRWIKGTPKGMEEFRADGRWQHRWKLRHHRHVAWKPAGLMNMRKSYRLPLEKFVFARAIQHLNPSIGRISCSASPVSESDVKDVGDFVEVGYIAHTHGVRGELHVYSVTDFPEERFEKPGKRWVQSKIMGKPVYQEVELLAGREVGGKRPSWLITLKGFNSVEKAQNLVGSTLVVTERPTLDDDEFYIPDLVGMAVIVQETGEEIGVILDVYNTGGDTDLLQVRRTDGTSGQKLWIPFVKEIVPVVDKDHRRVEINPPAGLLELNSPSKSKDEKAKRKRKANVKGRQDILLDTGSS